MWISTRIVYMNYKNKCSPPSPPAEGVWAGHAQADAAHGPVQAVPHNPSSLAGGGCCFCYSSRRRFCCCRRRRCCCAAANVVVDVIIAIKICNEIIIYHHRAFRVSVVWAQTRSGAWSRLDVVLVVVVVVVVVVVADAAAAAVVVVNIKIMIMICGGYFCGCWYEQ